MKFSEIVILMIVALPHTVMFVAYGVQSGISNFLSALFTGALAFFAYLGLRNWKKNESKLLKAKVAIDALEKLISLEISIHKLLSEDKEGFSVSEGYGEYNDMSQLESDILKINAPLALLDVELAKEFETKRVELIEFLKSHGKGLTKIKGSEGSIDEPSHKRVAGEAIVALAEAGMRKSLREILMYLVAFKQKLISAYNLD